MRKVSTIFLFAILLQISLCVGMSNASDKIIRTGQKQTVALKKKLAVPKYLNISFDPNIDKIPVPFVGHDIEQTYKAFDDRMKADQKDEFETTEQYQRRLTVQSKKPLYGSVDQTSVFAFVVSTDSKYNADTQTLTINLATSPVWQDIQIDRSKLALHIKDAVRTKKTSIGQNAFGAKVEIEKNYSKDFELAIHNLSEFETEKVLSEIDQESIKRDSEMRAKYNLPETSLFSPENMGQSAFVQRVKIEPKDARGIKDKISALILAKPIAPFISNGATLLEATIDSPTQYFSQMYYIDVDLSEIWIYNKLTGEIITKIKAK